MTAVFDCAKLSEMTDRFKFQYCGRSLFFFDIRFVTVSWEFYSLLRTEGCLAFFDYVTQRKKRVPLCRNGLRWQIVRVTDLNTHHIWEYLQSKLGRAVDFMTLPSHSDVAEKHIIILSNEQSCHNFHLWNNALQLKRTAAVTICAILARVKHVFLSLRKNFVFTSRTNWLMFSPRSINYTVCIKFYLKI